ncbi:MAG TPA: Fic family protein [Puia sp.]|jgi:Fic family protein|nr:Fic family protein [Puia sp.]
MSVININTVTFFPQDWMALTNELSLLDRFDASWKAIEKREQKTLSQLKSIATVRSVGASTRIEGSAMTDKEVETLIDHLEIATLTERDQQEVVGYWETLNLIAESYRDIPVAENSIKHLHSTMMKHSSKDAYHRGNYKINSNAVEATEPNGNKTIIFQTTPPGWQTQEAMSQLVNWYAEDTKTNSLIKAAVFVYEFLSIHPFQDGNGRLSRLLGTLLLLKGGYSWIQYVSFEHEIEHRKAEYYKMLMHCQRNRPGEDITSWVMFFLDCLKNIQTQLLTKITEKERRESVGVREQTIYGYVENHPGASSGEIAKNLLIPNPTVKKILADLVGNRNLIVHGAGRGTRYSIAATDLIRRDVGIRLTNKDRAKEFTFQQPGSFMRIRKIVLTPLFEWKHPDEWSARLAKNGLYFTAAITTSTSTRMSQMYSIFGYNDPTYYQPVFVVNPTIVLPDQLQSNPIFKLRFPINGTITLGGSVDKFDFDVMLVVDEA